MATKKTNDTAPLAAPRKRVGLKDLAEYLSLSQTTVSFVLNNAPQASELTEETRRRVREAAAKFNYRPSYFARNLNKAGSESVGVVAPEHSEGYFTMVMGGIERSLRERGFVYLTACHDWQPKLMREYPVLLTERGAEGLILLNTNAEFESPIPVVAISAHLKSPGVVNLEIDHEAAAELALDHLVGLGHRRIAFMHGHPDIVDSEPRWQTMMAAARRHGVEPEASLMTEMDSGSWSPLVGYGPTRRLLERTRAFTALVCFNDIAAFGAMRALHEAGLRVPQDVSVVGFDDVAGAQFAVPSLTTIQQPLAEMGTRAAEILLDRIARPQAPYEASVVFRPKLVVRESTGTASELAG